MKKIYMDEVDYNILSTIIQDLPWDVFVFGSRIKGTQRIFSDLDLCLKAKDEIASADIAMLKDALSESDLPFMVDVIDYDNLSESFKKMIDQDAVNFFETTPVSFI